LNSAASPKFALTPKDAPLKKQMLGKAEANALQQAEAP
jgi:hypothetical protein